MFFLFLFLFVAFCVGSSTTLVGFLQILAVGLAVSAAVFFFSVRFLGYSLKKEKLLLKILPFLLLYALSLVPEILKANAAVFKKIFGKETPEGCVVSFRAKTKGAFASTLFANAITLTPGTITVHTEGDLFTVHCLTKEFAEGIERTVPARCALKIDAILTAKSAKGGTDK